MAVKFPVELKNYKLDGPLPDTVWRSLTREQQEILSNFARRRREREAEENSDLRSPGQREDDARASAPEEDPE
jgi:hypothetical protein